MAKQGNRRGPLSRATRSIFGMLVVFVAPWAQALAGDPITIFAAASTKDAMEELSKQFELQAGTKVTAVFAASSTLARQISEGAPAELYLSASQEWMDHLKSHKAINLEHDVDLLGNELVLIVPDESPVRPEALTAKLLLSLGEGRIAVGDPAYVPAGIYARQALQALGVWESLESRLARGSDVRAALALVARGEVDAGIVYRSDTVSRPSVRVIAIFAESLHEPIRYPLAIVKGDSSTDSERLFEYLQSPQARDVFRQYGFIPLPAQ